MIRFFAIFIAVLAMLTGARASESVLKVNAGGQEKTYTIEALEALGVSTIRTTTTWTDGVQTFEGVSLAAIAKAHGAEAGKLIVGAINDYKAEIELSEVNAVPVMLATRMNGERMSVRDKGPFWVVYPRDDHPEFAEERHNYKWVWQVGTLEFK